MSGTTLDRGLEADGGLLASIAHPKTVNYLDVMGDAQKVAQGIWRNRESQANQLSGQAYQGAINPATGEFSPEKYRQNLVGAGPGAALAAREGLTTNQQLSDQQLKQAFAKLGFVQSQAGAMLAGGDFSDAGILGTFQKGIAAGVMTMPEVMRQLQTLPQDAAGRQKWLEQHRDSALTTQQQLEQQYGTGYTQHEGGGIGSGVTAPPRRGGGQTGATSTPMTPTVGEANEIVQVPYPQFLEDGKTANPNWGRTFPMPRTEFVKLLPTAGQGAGPPASLRNPARAAPAAPGTNQPAPAAPAAPGTAATPSIGTGPSPSDTVQQETQARQSATAFQAITDQSVQARTQSAVLGNMLADTTQFTTGPLADRIARIRAVAGRFGMPIDKEATGANESFNKLAAQLANAQGAGSDARLNVNVAANPHADLSPAGVDLMLRQLQGNADYLQARAKVASGYGDQKNIAGFEQEHGAKLDPRAFQFARMTVPQRQAYVKALSADDRKAVQGSYNYGHGAGLIGG